MGKNDYLYRRILIDRFVQNFVRNFDDGAPLNAACGLARSGGERRFAAA